MENATIKGGDMEAIRVEGIKKVYGVIDALKGVSFSIKRGSLVSILGPNGAGKTTLIRILTTLARPTQGDAYVAGYSVVKEPKKVRAQIGVVPQENNLDTYLTLEENLKLQAQLHGMERAKTKERVAYWLKKMELYERRKDFPPALSGGMARKLVLARALIHNPPVLFLDEPTTGLDPHARRETWAEITTFKRNTTVLLTTHYMEEADLLSDYIFIVDKGKIIREGTVSDLKKGGGTLEDLFIRLTGRGLESA